MKLLHTSDWHLGIDLHKHSLIEDQRYFLTQLYDIIQKEQIDVVIISGDIYDTTLASKEAIELFDEAMRMICKELSCRVIVIAGNHDSQTRLAVMADLLQESGLYLYGKLQELPKPLIIEDVEFYPLPYFHKDRVASFYGRTFRTYEEAALCLLDDIRAQKTTRKQIVLAHAFVNGASLSESDRFAMVGGSDLISKEVFHDLDYVALGHLHRPQTITPQLRYCGSPLAYAFSETKTKEVLIIDTDTMQVVAHEIQPLHPLVTLTGTYEEIVANLHEVRDAYVKVVLTDISVNFEILEFLRERCPYLLTLTSTVAEASMDALSLDVQALETLQDDAIIAQFFRDYYDREVSEEEMAWFKEAREGETVCG